MRLVVVDDDPDFRSLVTESAPPWLDIVECGSSREAVTLIRSERAEGAAFILVDLCMDPFLGRDHQGEGLELVRWLFARGHGSRAILMSGDRAALKVAQRTNPQVAGCLAKPLDLDRFYRFLSAFNELFGSEVA